MVARAHFTTMHSPVRAYYSIEVHLYGSDWARAYYTENCGWIRMDRKKIENNNTLNSHCNIANPTRAIPHPIMRHFTYRYARVYVSVCKCTTVRVLVNIRAIACVWVLCTRILSSTFRLGLVVQLVRSCVRGGEGRRGLRRIINQTRRNSSVYTNATVQRDNSEDSSNRVVAAWRVRRAGLCGDRDNVFRYTYTHTHVSSNSRTKATTERNNNFPTNKIEIRLVSSQALPQPSHMVSLSLFPAIGLRLLHGCHRRSSVYRGILIYTP